MVRALRETGNVKSNNSDLAIRNATIAAKKLTFYRSLLPIKLELYVELFVKSYLLSLPMIGLISDHIHYWEKAGILVFDRKV